jgi:arylformamidase
MTYWADWTDAQMEANFSPRKAVPGIEQHLEDFANRAAETRRFYDMRRNIAYGDHPREIYDVFPGIIGGPMHIFIHGGYWRALSKDDHSFVAPPFNAAGATVVMMNYPLCPEVTLSSLVASVMKGVAHAISNAADYGASPDRVHVSGHSAGGHLTAMAAAHDWTAYGLPVDAIKTAAPLSGIFDPRATRRIALNQEIGLDEKEAEANNVLSAGFAPLPHVRVLVAAGGAEPEGWIAQSKEYHRMFGVEAPVLLPDGANHFTLLDHVADPKADLCKAMLALMA